MYAPGLFGGDKNKAKSILREVVESQQLLEKDAFEAIFKSRYISKITK